MRHCYVLRVFTRDADTGGNHLGVITDCTGLPERVMQEIAAELGFSETIFLDWRQGSAPHVRIFTPARELPFAGHPLVGAAWILGAIGPGTVSAMNCGIGTVRFSAEDSAAQVEVALATDVEVATPAVLDGVGGVPRPQRAWWARMPLPYFVAAYDSVDAVAEARPEDGDLAGHPAGEALYLTCDDGERVKARFFAGGLGVPEDPATGSAAAAFAAVRVHEGETEGGRIVLQGDEMGHPSTIRVSWDETTVRLGGGVVKDEVRVIER